MTPRITNLPSPANVTLIDNGCIPMIARMMRTGICVNRDALADLSRYLDAECRRIEDEIEATVGQRVNPGSHPQIRRLLFHDLRVQNALPRRTLKITRSGLESTGKIELEPYLGTHPVVRLILQHRERAKLKGTYADAMLGWARRDQYGNWRVHTTIKPCSTDTGRLASEYPNLQNIPTRSELGRMIKNCFIAPPGKVLIEVDFSQIEMRVAAHLAGATAMITAFLHGRDIHVQTATRVYGLPESQIHETQHRYPCKRVGFGVLYRITGAGLVRQLNAEEAQDPQYPRAWTEDECDALITGWYDANPEIRDWQAEMDAQAYRTGMTWDLYGRVRLVPEVRSVHRWIREKGLRQAGNMPVQGGAQELIKIAMAQLSPVYDELRPLARVEPLMQIHDALLVEADGEYAAAVATVTRETMEQVAVLRVPIKADAKVGAASSTGWSDLKKLKAA
jgi:DNA polymerase I